jgi:hypothetical protein
MGEEWPSVIKKPRIIKPRSMQIFNYTKKIISVSMFL